MNNIGEKIWFESRILDRKAHLDVFSSNKRPRAIVLLFGGSGIDEEEYCRRGKTLIPVFDQLLSKSGILADLTFVHATAPFDIPYARFNDFPDAIEKWNSHVTQELLRPWRELPFLVSSFSGGACLAFNGIQANHRCIGGAALGVDSLPDNFSCPRHWPEKLKIFSAPSDPVCNAISNRIVIDRMVNEGQAVDHLLPSGRHRLTDYATEHGLGKLLLDLSQQESFEKG